MRLKIFILVLTPIFFICESLLAQSIGDFVSVNPNQRDATLRLPETHTFQKLIQEGDMMTGGASYQSNTDFTGYVPINGSSINGYLSINNEANNGGVAMLDINYSQNMKLWEVTYSKYVDFSAFGRTSRNCSGGVTPWGTILTSEEVSSTFDDINNDGYLDYGWQVEIDPVAKQVIDKRWALGRFAHENAVVHDNWRTVYQGADNSTGYLYKFVADLPADLSSGKLYVYKGSKNGGTGQWILIPNSTKNQRNNTKSQAQNVGATAFNGIEDVEIGPDGLVYFTVKSENKIYYFEDSDPISGTTVSFLNKYAGNRNYNISTANGNVTHNWGYGNDNLAFDNDGNLWVLQDGQNSHIWVLKKGHTEANPKVEIFATSPKGSEPTGITFSPDGRFIFLSIQHPSGFTYQTDAAGKNIRFNSDATLVIARKEHLGSECLGSCPDCNDNTQNYAESGTDCGGSCENCPTCFDRIKNGNETGIDCGGSSCVNCPTLNITKSDVTCKGTNNGTAIAVVTGGAGTITYLWSTGDTTARLENLNPGNYAVKIADSNGNQASRNITIFESSQLNITGTVSLPTAIAASNGAININVTGGKSPYSYKWSNNPTSKNVGSLSSGIYTVGVTDGNGCILHKAFNIELPSCSNFEVSLYTKNIDCANGSNGALTALIAGGTPPFSYNWSNGSTTKTIDNLTAGNYNVNIIDGNGCSVTSSATINTPANSLSISLTGIDTDALNATTGSVLAAISGGQTPYQYQWSNGGTSSAIANLSKGAYTLQVTDNNGCTAQQTATVSEYVCPTINATVSTTNITCYGSNDGIASTTQTGGTAPYNVIWSNGINGASTQNLTAGKHSVTIIDFKGCNKIVDFEIAEPTPIVAQLNITQPTDTLNNDGSASVVASGGGGVFTYNWSTGSTMSSINNLTNADYSIEVTDQFNCTNLSNFIIQADSCSYLSVQLSKNDVSCFGFNTGTITTSVVGATSPLSYAWSNGATLANLNNLPAEVYSVTVTDNSGCEAFAETKILQPSKNIGINIPLTEVTTMGGNDGTAMAIVNGGTPPYNYSWSNGVNTANVTNLSQGNYTLIVTDANSCSNNKTISISEVNCNAMEISLIAKNKGCAGAANVTIIASVKDATAPISYNWSNNANTPFLKNLSLTGSYSLTATDAKGCSTSKSVNIVDNSALQLSDNVTNLNAYNSNNGAISVIVNGGDNPYKYYWGNGANSASISNLTAGTYDFLAVDENGCTIITTNTVNNYNCDYEVLSIVENASCKNKNDGKITLAATGGSAPINYNWTDFAQNTRTRINLANNNYAATIIDNKNCKVQIDALVEEPTASFSINVNKTDETYFNGSNGTATVTPIGGIQPITYKWSTGLGNATVNNLSANSYTVEATDANGCIANRNFTISGVSCANLSLNVNKNDVDCFDEANGNATAIVTGGVAPYSISWLNGDVGVASNALAVAAYATHIVDAVGCEANASFNITQPTELLFTSNKTNVTYFAAQNGTASVSVNGGVTPYTYSWSNGATTNAIANLTPGQYTVNVTDDNNCTLTESFIVEDVDCKSIDISEVTRKNVTCRNDNDGEIAVQITGGNFPFSYIWSNGSTQPQIKNLSTGTYTVRITDSKGCKDGRTIVLNNPANLNVNLNTNNITQAGTNNGSATLAITGGFPPYTINWSNGATTAAVNNFSPGTHSYTVVDSNGCERTGNFTLCTPPYNVEELSILDNAAVIGWDGDPSDSNYNYQYKNLTDGTAWQTGSTTNTFLLLNNLPSCKTFEFSVFGSCSPTNGTSRQFNTDGCLGCVATNNLYHLNVKDVSAFINWDLVPGATYTLYYKKTGAAKWFSYTTSITYAILYGLSPCSTYEWYVDTNCNSGTVFHTNLKDKFTTVCLKEDGVNAIERIANIELIVYPNPAKDFIILSAYTSFNIEGKTATISLYDFTGKLIVTNDEVEQLSNYKIDIASLSNGLYIVEVKMGDFIKEIKFVKE